MVKFSIYFGVYLYTIWLHYVLGKDGAGGKDFVIAKLNIVFKMILSSMIYISVVSVNKFVLVAVILPYMVPLVYKIENFNNMNFNAYKIKNKKLILIDTISILLLIIVSII